MTKSIRIVVVDDSSVFRYWLTATLQDIDHVSVVGVASDGVAALNKIKATEPDLVTLDVEMPGMDGVEVLKVLKQKWPGTKVIMLTSQNRFTVSKTIKALELSAFGYLLKPEDGRTEQFTYELNKYISVIHKVLNNTSVQYFVDTERKKPAAQTKNYPSMTKRPLLIAIGGSTGAPDALFRIIPRLPQSLPVPVVIVVHMPEGFTASFAQQLDTKSKVHVKEAEDNEKLHPGTVYIAPGGQQMKIIPSDIGIGQIRCSNDSAGYPNTPSVDYLFTSLAKSFPARVMPIILTGIGSDGTAGLRALKETGVHSIAQNKITSTVFGMPGSAIHAGVVDQILPLEKVVGAILNHL